MENAIIIESLKRNYGKVTAVKGVSYSVSEGEMFGLVGPDGAGKTTTIRMLTGLLRPDSGNAKVLGYDLLTQQNLIKNEIGYLSQKFSLYGDEYKVSNFGGSLVFLSNMSIPVCSFCFLFFLLIIFIFPNIS